MKRVTMEVWRCGDEVWLKLESCLGGNNDDPPMTLNGRLAR